PTLFRSKKAAGTGPAASITHTRLRSELVAEADLHRPAGLEVGQEALVHLATVEVVDVLAGGLVDAHEAHGAHVAVRRLVRDAAPVLVDQVADVHHVEPDLGLVPLEEAGQLLGDADVDV